MDNIQVIGVAPELKIMQLQNDIAVLQKKLSDTEALLQAVIKDRDQNYIKKLSKEERDKRRIELQEAVMQRRLTGLKKDGRRISTPADELRSYDEIQIFLSNLKSHGRMRIRNWAMFRVGICFGVRISDLTKIKWSWVLNPDFTYRERIPLVERKTSKLNNIIITEAVRETLDEYISWLGEVRLDDYVFGKSNGEQLAPKSASQILVDANKIVGLPIHISSHSMRKTFGNIVVSTYDGSMTADVIDRVRSLFNHESIKTTKMYLGVVQREDDNARKAVSDFILGKSDINELGVPKQKTNNELYDVLTELKDEIQTIKEIL